jgi:transposase
MCRFTRRNPSRRNRIYDFCDRIHRGRSSSNSTGASTGCSRTRRKFFSHLRERWQDLFGARFNVLLYDLTSTYFESDLPADAADKRRYSYSRDKRPDCVQVVIALIVTPEGFPLA